METLATCTRGLVLGKFAPFHAGHQFLVERALAENDEVAVVIYDSPEATDVPLPVRAQWIRDIYAGTPGMTVVGDGCPPAAAAGDEAESTCLGFRGVLPSADEGVGNSAAGSTDGGASTGRCGSPTGTGTQKVVGDGGAGLSRLCDSGSPVRVGRVLVVIEAWDGPSEVGDTPAIKAAHEAYLQGLLGRKLAGRRTARPLSPAAGPSLLPAPGGAAALTAASALLGDSTSGDAAAGAPTPLTSAPSLPPCSPAPTSSLPLPPLAPAAPVPGLISGFYSCEFYGQHVAASLDATDRRFDRTATLAHLPRGGEVSGTLSRAQPFAMLRAGLLHPRVYRDLIPWVAFLGAPSTGKSTITAACAAAFTPSGVYMPEYGREYWEEHAVDRRLSLRQLVDLARGHMEREEAAAARCDGPLFVDTTALTTHTFSLDYHGAAAPELAALAAQAASRYDVVFLCGDDIPYDDTEDRSGPQHRAAFQKRVVADLRARRVPYHTLRGSVADRVAEVGRVLAARGIRVTQQQLLHQPACEAAGADAGSARECVCACVAGAAATSTSLRSDSGAAATPAGALSEPNAAAAAGAAGCQHGPSGGAGSCFRRPAGGHRDAAGKWGSLELERC